MTNQELEDYFEQLATKFKPIGHTPAAPRYCRFNIDEVASGFRHKLDLSKFCLMLEAPAGGLEDNNGDGYFDNQEVAFSIVRRAPPRDFEQEKLILSESRQLGLQLMARILKDGEFADLDENTIEYEKMGGEKVWSNCYGYRFSFTLVDTVNLSTDPDLWDE